VKLPFGRIVADEEINPDKDDSDGASESQVDDRDDYQTCDALERGRDPC
jgi:hypothetical protein